MVIDFSQIDLKRRPTLVLRNMDEKAIGSLSHAIDIHLEIHLGEISELTFTYPYQENGTVLPEYSLLTGLRIVDVVGYGQFILRNPEETDDGVMRKKSCTAYSLEYEFNNDTITLEEGTYNFWNPVAQNGTLMQLILEKMPHWTLGTVSNSLIGKYRTFSVDSQSIYDFMMNYMQQTFDCIFIFDTYNKTVSAIGTAEPVAVNPVYLSNRNLIKEMQIEESTDDQTTVLDVYGADGVDIRSVNPMGDNRLYNLDAYMNESYFDDQNIIDNWARWKADFPAYQSQYFNLVMRMQMKVAQLSTEMAVLNELNGEYTTLEAQLAVLLQQHAIDPESQTVTDALAACRTNMAAKQSDINAQKSLIEDIETEITTVQASLKNINDAVAFSRYFSPEELLVLRRYFKVGALTDSTFVASDYGSYTGRSVASDMDGFAGTLEITGADVDSVDDDGVVFYTIRGGTVSWEQSITDGAATVSGYYIKDDGDPAESSYSAYINYIQVNASTDYMLVCDHTIAPQTYYLKIVEYDAGGAFLRVTKRNMTGEVSGPFTTGVDTAQIRISIGNTAYVSDVNIYRAGGYISGEVINGTIQINTDDSFLMSMYLNGGTFEDGSEFNAGTLSMSGDEDSVASTGSTLSISVTGSKMYLTHETTEYQKASVAWELYEYAQHAMERLAWPTYHFSVESANFLVLDEFYEFAQHFKIGERVYLHLDDGVITPVVIGASIGFDDPSEFSIEFSDSYTTNDKSFTLEALLDRAVSMGHNLDLQQYNYSNFVNSGASTSVKSFMDSAIDTMKNNIIAGSDNEIVIDQAGIRARKYNPSTGQYDGKQLWISNNSLMMTDDGWQHATIGIGEFNDPNFNGTLYGIVAPMLAGTIITGNNLIIESESETGAVKKFRVDGSGASLHNATFSLYDESAQSVGGRLQLDPAVGFVGGSDYEHLLHVDSTTHNVDGVLAADDSSRIASVGDIDTSSEDTTPNANFWIDMYGGAFFKGKIIADSGSFGGWTLAENKLWSGSGSTYVALSSSTNGVTDTWPAEGRSVTTGHYLDDSGTDKTGKDKAYKTPKLTVTGNTVYELTYTVTHGTSNLYMRVHEYNGNTLIDMPIKQNLKGTNGVTETNSITFTTDADANGLVISVESYDYISTTSGSLILRELNNTLYAIWAGDGSAAKAPFSVKRDGTVTANNGTFGNLEVETVSSGGQTTTTTKIIDGALSVAPASGGRSGGIIYAGSVSNDHHKFEVDENGDVWMTGSLHMPANGSITWASGDPSQAALDIGNGTYSGTFINGKKIYSPEIYANLFTVIPETTSTSGGFVLKDGRGYDRLTISYYDSLGQPFVNFAGKTDTTVNWAMPNTYFMNSIIYDAGCTVSFASGSTVSGLKVNVGGTVYSVYVG